MPFTALACIVQNTSLARVLTCLPVYRSKVLLKLAGYNKSPYQDVTPASLWYMKKVDVEA